ncbi:MAG: PatB family C-S lyase [Cellvibrio sp.]|jgi:Bifunctional PLP-dependent enzyme with beta-cystathionase and maltose regulon repressor activities
MEFDFDIPVPREGTHSVKFDGRQQYFGTAEVTPMWVADMDFAVPPCVTRALLARAAHPVFGYTLYPESLYQSVIGWFQRRHHWSIERDWIVMAPGVVPSLHACCLAFAEAGEGVIVQPPVYFPFFSAVTETKRQLVLNPLQSINGRYEINLKQLENQARDARILMLCTPHNPVGRVWSKAELISVLRIAKAHNLIVLSDDIHADLVYPGVSHTMIGTLETELGEFIRTNVITAVAPSKTFNIPGLGLSCLIVPNPQHREALQKVFELLHVSNSNPFSIAAFEAAYNEGDVWLDSLMVYLQENKRLVRDFLAQNVPQIRCADPEGTYLLWLDCSDLQLTDAQLRDFFIKDCKVGMNPGIVFGEEGKGFMRMNIGTTRARLSAALESIRVGMAAIE